MLHPAYMFILYMISYILDDSDDDETNSDSEDSGDVWTICDSHNFLIGARTQRSGETPSECVLQLLVENMRQPLSWSPRRPKYVSMRNATET